MVRKQLPTLCPSCKRLLKVRNLTCASCETSVTGDFDLPALARLSDEDQDFILRLIGASGSLKELAGHYGISYPTIRNRLDALIGTINQLKNDENGKDKMDE
jgi:hypothetical protein